MVAVNGPANAWVHVVCVIWTPETTFMDKDALRDPSLGAVFEKRRKLKCNVCLSRGHAAIQCCIPCCSVAFNVPCAMDAGYVFEIKDAGDDVKLKAYCGTHRPPVFSRIELGRAIHTLPASVRQGVCASALACGGSVAPSASGARATPGQGDAMGGDSGDEGEGEEEDSGELLCVCRRTYAQDSSFMVECDSGSGGCGGWFHPPCLGLAPCTAHGLDSCLVVRTKETLYGPVYSRGDHVDITGTFTCPACYHAHAHAHATSSPVVTLATVATGAGTLASLAPCQGVALDAETQLGEVGQGGRGGGALDACVDPCGGSSGGAGGGAGGGACGPSSAARCNPSPFCPPAATPTNSCVTPETTGTAQAGHTQRPRRSGGGSQAPISAFFAPRSACQPSSAVVPTGRSSRRSGENSVPGTATLACASGRRSGDRGTLKRKPEGALPQAGAMASDDASTGNTKRRGPADPEFPDAADVPGEGRDGEGSPPPLRPAPSRTRPRRGVL